MTIPFTLYIALALIAFLYASVGHGGATGYIAIMTLFDYPPIVIKHTALILNILVAGTTFILNAFNNKIQYKILLPLLLASVPCAYFGSTISLSHPYFHYTLALVLLIPIYFLWFPPKGQEESIVAVSPFVLLPIGATIGFISGLLGIGGGIFLSPILILKNWCSPKETSVLSALFIVINSISGLVAIGTTFSLPEEPLHFIFMGMIGGIAGGVLGSKHFSPAVLKKLIAMVLVIAVFKLFITA